VILTKYRNQILVRKLSFQFVHFCIHHPRTGHEGSKWV